MKAKPKVVNKSWGHEVWFANGVYCGKEIFVRDGYTSSYGRFHFHKIKDETFYIIAGKLMLDYYKPAPESEEPLQYRVYLKRGDSFHVLPLMRHRFRAVDGNCRFVEASTHHEDEDSYYEEV